MGKTMAGTSEGEWCLSECCGCRYKHCNTESLGKMSPHPEIISSKDGNLAGGGEP